MGDCEKQKCKTKIMAMNSAVSFQENKSILTPKNGVQGVCQGRTISE